MFILIEGFDAVGKTTLVDKLLVKLTNEEKRSTYAINFPRYKTKLGETILWWLKNGNNLRYPLAFQAMMTADKVDAERDINEALQRGQIVVCGRYWPSAFAYGAASCISKQLLWDLHASLPMPTHNILLDMDVQKALARRPEKRDAYERNPTFLEKVRQEYIDLWAVPPTKKGRWIKVDASQSPDEVFSRVWTEIFSAPL